MNRSRFLISVAGTGILGVGALGRVPITWLEEQKQWGTLSSLLASLAGSVKDFEWPFPQWSVSLVEMGLPAPAAGDMLIGLGMALLGGVILSRRRVNQNGPGTALATRTVGFDRKARRRSRRQARVLARRGELEAAAELCWEAGEFDSAVTHFEQADLVARAADVRHDQELYVDAAVLLAQAGEYDRAAALFSQEKEWTQAARCYEQLGRSGQAAEMHEKGGQLRAAAEGYEQAEYFTEAARVWVLVEGWEKAALCLERVLAESQLRSQSDFTPSQTGQDLARRIVELYGRSGDAARGLAALEKVECWREAAELALSLGDDVMAARAFHKAGDAVRSAEALQRAGDDKKAARQLSDHYRDREELGLAAQCLEEVGDYAEAGDLFRQKGAFDRAASCYRNQGDWSSAAEMYALEGEGASAADCYEKAGAFEQAAECYSRLEREDRAAENFERAGLYLRSARVFCSIQREEEAVASLQKLTSQDPEFMEGSALLAELFCARNQPELAIHALEAAIGEAEIDRMNLVAFHALACALERSEKWLRCAELYERILSLDITYKDVAPRLVKVREQIARQPQDVAKEPQDEEGSVPNASRYAIRGELGRGGMGIVYEAFDTVLDRRVAFKVLPGHLTSPGQDSGHFLREAKAAAKLNHPNIVTVYDAGRQGGRLYIAMEHVDGITFKQIISRRGALAVRGTLYVALQLCEALAYAHAQKVVHRDIKPANIMWTRNKNTKIMDFGLAKIMKEVCHQTTAVAGTPYYMSPEQTLGKNVDHRTDIYALGVSLFEMLTGTVPFKEGDIPYHHMHTPPPDVREHLPGTPQPIADLIARCLDKNPAARFQTAEEMAERVREIS